MGKINDVVIDKSNDKCEIALNSMLDIADSVYPMTKLERDALGREFMRVWNNCVNYSESH